MESTKLNRRNFLGGATLAAGTLAAASCAQSPAPQAAAKPEFVLSVATYSLRKFDRPTAIKMIQDLGVKHVCAKSFHLPYEASPEELAAIRKEYEDAGLKIIGGGTVTMQKEDEAEMRAYFEYAKHSGMGFMVIAPTVQTLPMIEKFVKEYDIAVAIHNHGTEDKHFPGPQDVLPHIKDMDPRMGLCVDLGHTTRTGINIIEALEMSGSRILDVHIKDLKDLMVKGSDIEVGRGAMPIAKIFQTLAKMGYKRQVGLEYEIKADDPFPGMNESYAYQRGVLAAMNL
ncbi:MAG: sugar phosphate isomerase/epimerase [Bryobacterales bacterium]|nr:sugar phosphate isomerase/epimerase [Bryobacterales bacterium]